MRRLQAILLPVILVACMLLPAGAGLSLVKADSASAPRAAGVQLNVQAGFGGYIRAGGWAPVQVQLSNDGPPVNGMVDAAIQNGKHVFTPVQLPTNSSKQITLYVPAPDNASGSYQVTVALKSDHGSVVTQDTRLSIVAPGAALVGVMTQNPGAFSALSRITLPGRQHATVQVPLGLDMITSRAAILDGFDAIVINDIPAGSQGLDTLSQEQQDSLSAWVQAGGTLILGGGQSWLRTRASIPQALVPVQGGTIRSVSKLDALSTWAGVPLPGSATYTAVSAQPVQDARIVVSQDDLPLVVEKTAGLGRTIWTALELTLDPVPTWNNGDTFWRALLRSAWVGPDRPSIVPVSDNLNQALRSMNQAPMPSLVLLWVFLAFYIVAIGPLNYIILRRIDRRELAWVTIPAMILIATAVVYGVGYTLRGTKPLLFQVSVIDAAPQSQIVPVDTLFSLFSPNESRYTLELSGNMLVASSSGNIIPSVGTQGDPQPVQVVDRADGTTLLPDIAVRTGEARAFRASGSMAMAGQIESNLTGDGKTISGTITNKTGLTLHDTYLVLGAAHVALGDLAPGASTPVKMSLSALPTSPFPPPLGTQIYSLTGSGVPVNTSRSAEVHRQILDALWGVDGTTEYKLRLIGWLDQPPVHVQLAGEDAAVTQETLYTTPLPLQIANGQASIPANTIAWQVVSLDSYSRNYRLPGLALSANSNILMEYTLPDTGKPVEVSKLTLNITQMMYGKGGSGNLNLGNDEVSLYSWDTGQWVAARAVLGTSISYQQPQRFISPDGKVRLQYSHKSNGDLNIDAPALSVELKE